MFTTARRHHHPPDHWQPDDADELSEEVTIEEMRHASDWDSTRDLNGGRELLAARTRRRRRVDAAATSPGRIARA
jgi:hypothetical protein